MKYWFGFRVFDPKIDLAPQRKVLLGPFNTYEEAKLKRKNNMASDMLQTEIFQAETRVEAQEKMEKESFKRF